MNWFILLIPLLPVFIAFFSAVPPLLKLLLCLVSCFISAYPLAVACFRDIAKKKTVNRTLLLLLGCLLSLFCKAYAAAALSLVFYRAGCLLLSLYAGKLRRRLDQVRKTNPLASYISPYRSAALPVRGLFGFCRRWLNYILLLAACLCAVLFSVFGSSGISEALRRSAVVLMLGGELCAAFSLADYRSAVSAAESSVLLSAGSLDKLYRSRKLCLDLKNPETIRNAVIYPADPAQYPPAEMARLASMVWYPTNRLLARALLALCKETPDMSEIQRFRALDRLGSVAMIDDQIVICGNAKLMHRIALPVVPFESGKAILHLAVEGKYLGCICFGSDLIDLALWAKLRKDNRFYAYPNVRAAADHRKRGETLLFLSSGPRHLPVTSTDCYVSLGGYGVDADIFTAECGRGGGILVLRCLSKARKRRRRSFLTVAICKLVLLALALLGFLPIVFCIPLELLSVGLSYRIAAGKVY